MDFSPLKHHSKLLGAIVIACGALAPQAQGAVLTLNYDGCASLTVTGAGTSNVQVACANTSVAPTAPSGCQVVASSSAAIGGNGTSALTLGAGGGTVTFTASCATNGGNVSSWNWSGVPGTANNASNSASATITQPTTVSISPAGSAETRSASVTIGGNSSGPDTSDISAACAAVLTGYPVGQFAISKVIPLPVSYYTSQRFLPDSGTGGFGYQTAIVAAFTPDAADVGKTGSFSWGEYQATGTQRLASISSRACDFGSSAKRVAGQTGNITFVVGQDVMPGKTYYFTIVNQNTNGTTSCRSGECSMLVQYSRP